MRFVSGGYATLGTMTVSRGILYRYTPWITGGSEAYSTVGVEEVVGIYPVTANRKIKPIFPAVSPVPPAPVPRAAAWPSGGWETGPAVGVYALGGKTQVLPLHAMEWTAAFRRMQAVGFPRASAAGILADQTSGLSKLRGAALRLALGAPEGWLGCPGGDSCVFR
jgi:hypothetical protein